MRDEMKIEEGRTVLEKTGRALDVLATHKMSKPQTILPRIGYQFARVAQDIYRIPYRVLTTSPIYWFAVVPPLQKLSGIPGLSVMENFPESITWVKNPWCRAASASASLIWNTTLGAGMAACQIAGKLTSYMTVRLGYVAMNLAATALKTAKPNWLPNYQPTLLRADQDKTQFRYATSIGALLSTVTYMAIAGTLATSSIANAAFERDTPTSQEQLVAMGDDRHPSIICSPNGDEAHQAWVDGLTTEDLRYIMSGHDQYMDDPDKALVYQTILEANKTSDVFMPFLDGLARGENGFGRDVISNTSSARSLWQILNSTWYYYADQNMESTESYKRLVRIEDALNNGTVSLTDTVEGLNVQDAVLLLNGIQSELNRYRTSSNKSRFIRNLRRTQSANTQEFLGLRDDNELSTGLVLNHVLEDFPDLVSETMEGVDLDEFLAKALEFKRDHFLGQRGRAILEDGVRDNPNHNAYNTFKNQINANPWWAAQVTWETRKDGNGNVITETYEAEEERQILNSETNLNETITVVVEKTRSKRFGNISYQTSYDAINEYYGRHLRDAFALSQSGPTTLNEACYTGALGENGLPEDWHKADALTGSSTWNSSWRPWLIRLLNKVEYGTPHPESGNYPAARFASMTGNGLQRFDDHRRDVGVVSAVQSRFETIPYTVKNWFNYTSVESTGNAAIENASIESNLFANVTTSDQLISVLERQGVKDPKLAKYAAAAMTTERGAWGSEGIAWKASGDLPGVEGIPVLENFMQWQEANGREHTDFFAKTRAQLAAVHGENYLDLLNQEEPAGPATAAALDTPPAP